MNSHKTADFTLDFEGTKKLYDFLRGKGNVDIKSLHEAVLVDYDIETRKSHLPNLTDEQAFLVIYVLQEAYGIIPFNYEQCSYCGELYDSDKEYDYTRPVGYCAACWTE